MDTIGGYQIVRRLGAGERAEVFLGRAGSSQQLRGSLAAIKIFRPGVEQSSIDQEVDVLSRTRSRHLLQLQDVATARDGRQCLVFSRLTGGSLARLIADRSRLARGELVTILAPLSEAIAELHDARCCHGALRPGSIFFDQVGAPVIACFGRASTFGNTDKDRTIQHATPAELAAEPRVTGDLQQLRMLAGLLVARAFPGGPTGTALELLRWLDAAERQSEVATFARELSDRLFALAPACPVDVGPPTGPARTSLARGDQASVVVACREETALVLDAPQESAGTRSRLARQYLRTRALVRKATATMMAVRRPFRVLACVGLAAAVLAIVLVPSTTGSLGNSPGDTAEAKERAAFQDQQRSATPTPIPAATGAADDGKTQSDDPVAAVTALLRERDACIRRLSVRCLDSVNQRESSSWENDAYLVRSLQEGGVPAAGVSLAGSTFTLTERLGDSALLAAGPPGSADAQSILVIKGESGWRIRDFLPG